MWCQVIAGLLTCAGCLPEPGSPHDSPAISAPSSLVVRDHAGAVWSAQALPRTPRFVLGFDSVPEHAQDRLWLVAESATPDVLEDLADPPLRAATQQALVPLTVQEGDRELVAEPQAPLAAGARYALVFTRGDEPASLYPLEVSTSPAAGASWVESWPGDRDLRVPVNARRFLLRFDGYVRNLDAEHVLMRSAVGTASEGTA